MEKVMTVWKNLTYGTAHAWGISSDSPTSGTSNADIMIDWEEPKGESMKVKRLQEDAVLPTKAHTGDLGYDLYANEDITLYPVSTELVSTGVSIQFPKGFGGLIKDRSSIATKRKVFTVAGVIDNGYTGEIRIALFNSTPYRINFNKGDKIAQLVLIPVTDFEIEEVDEIVTSDGRGEDGFGSTGE